MKLQISYNFPDIQQAIEIAQQTAEFADIIGVGSLLLFKEGIKAIKLFKSTFPNKEIFAEAKIIEKAQDSVTMLAQAGARYISVLAGSPHNTIKKAVETAKLFDAKIALDLLDAHSIGQSAHDAKTIGIDMLIINRIPHIPGTNLEVESEWHSARENTALPIFITGKIDKSNIQQIIDLKPHGILIGSAITRANSPKQEAYNIKNLL
jgi:3-hexulose-6-phosphate synthase